MDSRSGREGKTAQNPWTVDRGMMILTLGMLLFSSFLTLPCFCFCPLEQLAARDLEVQASLRWRDGGDDIYWSVDGRRRCGDMAVMLALRACYWCCCCIYYFHPPRTGFFMFFEKELLGVAILFERKRWRGPGQAKQSKAQKASVSSGLHRMLGLTPSKP